ncbi:MAG: hypothetical protein OXG56_12370 [Gammaproteobacteria bacterium]|nr:hypothetical protein [Gammaproteobacteria bacterium]
MTRKNGNSEILALGYLYHARWGIEELYKISKQRMAIEEFHSRSERHRSERGSNRNYMPTRS